MLQSSTRHGLKRKTSGKSKFIIPSNYAQSAAKAASLVKNSKSGEINATKVNPYAVLMDIGPYRTNVSKNPDGTIKWSITTANHTVFIAQMDDIIPSNGVTLRNDVDGSITFLGEWDNKTKEHLATTRNRNLRPDSEHHVTLRPGVFSVLRMKKGTAKVGDIIRVIDIHMNIGINHTQDAIEKWGLQSGWFEAERSTPLSRIDPSDRFDMYDRAGMITTYLPPPDLSGASINYKDPTRKQYTMWVGPSSMMEDPETGEIFKLDLVRDASRFSADKRAPLGWRAKDEKNPGKQPILDILVAGFQRRVFSGVAEDSRFIWKMTLWPSGEAKNKDGDIVYRTSEIGIFGISSVKMWEALMPVYFPKMEILYVVKENTEGTAMLLGDLSSGDSSILKNDPEENGSFSRDDRLGIVSATDHGDDDMDGMMDFGGEESQNVESEAPKDKRAVPVEFDSDTPTMDFGYKFYVSHLEFAARDFWKSHGLEISLAVAARVVGMTGQDAPTLELDPEFTHQTPSELKRVKIDRENQSNSHIMASTDCICMSDKFQGYKKLFDPKRTDIDCFVAAVPWRDYRDDYDEKIEAMSVDVQTSLFLSLYNFYEKLATKNSKMTETQLEVFIPSVDMDSDEWVESGAAYIYENETELRSSDWKTCFPGVFAIWKADERESKKGLDAIEFLLGDHPQQAKIVERVRGPVVIEVEEEEEETIKSGKKAKKSVEEEVEEISDDEDSLSDSEDADE
jgi:hypothetical protein